MNKKNLFTALAAFQNDCPILIKDSDSDDGNFRIKRLGQIIHEIKPLLKQHKLGFTQPPDGRRVKTIIFHTESGESLEGVVDIPDNVNLSGLNKFQELGYGITYLRRKSLLSMLGLVADKDTDSIPQVVNQGVGDNIQQNMESINSATDEKVCDMKAYRAHSAVIGTWFHQGLKPLEVIEKFAVQYDRMTEEVKAEIHQRFEQLQALKETQNGQTV